MAGGQRRIDVFCVPCDHATGDADDRLQPGRRRNLEGRRLRREHALRDAVVIAQIDEEQLAVIALAMDPPGESHGAADIFRPQRGRRRGGFARLGPEA